MPETKIKEDVDPNDKVDAPDDGDDDAEEKDAQIVKDDDGNATVKLPQTRREKRRARYDEVAAERDQMRRELDGHKLELERQRAHSAALAAQFDQMRSVQRPEDRKDDYKEQLTSIRREQEMIQATIRKGEITEGQAEDLRKRFYDLQDKWDEMKEARVLEKVGKIIPQQEPGGDEARILQMEFPEEIGRAHV